MIGIFKIRKSIEFFYLKDIIYQYIIDSSWIVVVIVCLAKSFSCFYKCVFHIAFYIPICVRKSSIIHITGYNFFTGKIFHVFEYQFGLQLLFFKSITQSIQYHLRISFINSIVDLWTYIDRLQMDAIYANGIFVFYYIRVNYVVVRIG